MARKAKRKSHASGGPVDQLEETYRASPKTPETMARYSAASRAIRGGWMNDERISPKADLTPETRANYPGFKKGGKVKKVIRRKK